MSVDEQLIYRKLDFLHEQLAKIGCMDFDEKKLVESVDIQDLLVFRLQQAVETCIDIATHLIAGLELPRKETAKDAFELLGREGMINQELASRMAQSVSFRNRVVHGYNDFDFRLLYEDYQGDIHDLNNFGQEILNFLEQQK